MNYVVLECYQIISEDECFAAIEANQVVRVQNDADQEQMTIDAHVSVSYKDNETLIVKCKRGFTPALSLHVKPVFKSVLGHYGRVSISEERENRDRYTVYEVSLFPKYQRSKSWSIDDMKQAFTRDLKLKIRNVAGVGAIIAMVVTAGASGIIMRAAVKKGSDEFKKFSEESERKFEEDSKKMDEDFKAWSKKINDDFEATVKKNHEEFENASKKMREDFEKFKFGGNK